LEAKQVDIAPKEALRVKEILVDEGALVEPNQVLVRMDTATLEAELAEAEADVASTQQRQAVVDSGIAKRKSEAELAVIELERTRKLLATSAASQEEFDRRNAYVQVSAAAVEEEEAELRTVQLEIKAAQAKVATIQTRIDDATLKAPVRGRVLYRLAEVGEVLAAGGKVLTLVNLEDVYMEIYLPSQQAASVKIGADARITVDYDPGRAAAGQVSFVSPEAQFTPKQVETRSERDKLMFRVKIQLPKTLVAAHIERIKTGVRGVGYVKIDESAVWPDWLQNLLTPSEEPDAGKRSLVQELAPSDSQDAATTEQRKSAEAKSPPEGT
jgi:HlyD family secretion protein